MALEIASPRILRCKVTEHPTSEWTIQQFREWLAFDYPYGSWIYGRDSIFANAVEEA